MNEICRVCLEHSNSMNSLLGVNGAQLYRKIQSIAPVQIVLHGKLPAAVCLDCTEKIESCLVFRQTIERNDQILKTRLADETSRVYKDGSTKYNNVIEETETHGNSNNAKSTLVVKNVCSETLQYLEICVKDDQQQEKAPRIAEACIEHKPADKKSVCMQNTSYCQICLHQFIDNSIHSLITHAKSHFGEKGTVQNESPFTCELCNKMFKTRYRFVSHQRSHWGLRPFACRQCQFAFSDLDLLNDHRSDCGNKCFPCKCCGKLFKSKQDLTRHQSTHKDTSPLNCDLCSKLFSNERTFRDHIRKHAIGKSYVCEICSKSYYTNAHLRKHQGIHILSHLCSICGKAFASNSDLNRHLMYHNKKKQFTCNICKSKFFEHSHLIEHKKAKHSNESYTCEICGKLFSSSRSLRMHQKRHMLMDSNPLNLLNTPYLKQNNNLGIVMREKNSFGVSNQVESRSLITKPAKDAFDNENASTDAGFILITEPDQTANLMTSVAAAKDVMLYVLSGDTITFDSLQN